MPAVSSSLAQYLRGDSSVAQNGGGMDIAERLGQQRRRRGGGAGSRPAGWMRAGFVPCVGGVPFERAWCQWQHRSLPSYRNEFESRSPLQEWVKRRVMTLAHPPMREIRLF